MEEKFLSCVDNNYEDLWDSNEKKETTNNYFIPLDKIETEVYYEIRSAQSARAIAEYKIENGRK